MTGRVARELTVGLTSALSLAALASAGAHLLPAVVGLLALALAPFVRPWTRRPPWAILTAAVLTSSSRRS